MVTSRNIIKQVQRFALYLFFFSINFEMWDPFNTDGYFSVSKFTGLVYVLTIIPMIRYIKKSDINNKLLISIWLFFAMLTLVGLFNINVISSGFFDFTMFQNIFLFWFLLIHERNDHFVLEKGLISFALGSVALALLFYAGVGIAYEGSRVRIFGDNQNTIGLRMSISLAILVLAIAQNRLKFGKIRYILFLPIPIMLQLMVETGSRGAFISFSLTFITGLILYNTRNIISKLFIVSFAAITSSILWIYLMQSKTLLQRIIISSEEGDLAGRDVIWQKLLPLIENNPIFGVGRTGYAYFTEINNFGKVNSPHNVILEVLCYTGIIGLIIYLYFIFRILKAGYNKYRAEGLVLPLLLFIPILGMILSGQLLGVKIGWVIFAYISCRSVLHQKSQTINDNIIALKWHE